MSNYRTAHGASNSHRYHVWERGPFYFEIRDRVTGDYVDVRVGTGAREAALGECARRNAEDARGGGSR